ncbi:MAG: hypothetical protein SWZ49_05675 [Cyanobacteriota bacterium]|nr:hypothetical protein [Cyanobacteriota bacterium]
MAVGNERFRILRKIGDGDVLPRSPVCAAQFGGKLSSLQLSETDFSI